MKVIQVLCAVLCVAASNTSAIAATTEDTSKQAVITLSLHHTPVHVALQFISQQSGIKIYYNKAE